MPLCVLFVCVVESVRVDACVLRNADGLMIDAIITVNPMGELADAGWLG